VAVRNYDVAVSAIYDWATPDNLQPEPVTVEIWRNLPEEYCRQVEIVNGQVVRCAAPTRTHQNAARRLTNMLESAAEEHMAAHPGECLDVTSDVDITLWEVPSYGSRTWGCDLRCREGWAGLGIRGQPPGDQCV
jgi:hypothetical protein